MKYEDTVMSRDEIRLRLGYITHNTEDITEVGKVLTTQAELAFKAGYEQCRKVDGDIYKQGKKEVVDWVELHMPIVDDWRFKDKWQAQLKEWNIKEN